MATTVVGLTHGLSHKTLGLEFGLAPLSFSIFKCEIIFLAVHKLYFIY